MTPEPKRPPLRRPLGPESSEFDETLLECSRFSNLPEYKSTFFDVSGALLQGLARKPEPFFVNSVKSPALLTTCNRDHDIVVSQRGRLEKESRFGGITSTCITHRKDMTLEGSWGKVGELCLG